MCNERRRTRVQVLRNVTGDSKLSYSSCLHVADMVVYFRTWLVYWLIV